MKNFLKWLESALIAMLVTLAFSCGGSDGEEPDAKQDAYFEGLLSGKVGCLIAEGELGSAVESAEKVSGSFVVRQYFCGGCTEGVEPYKIGDTRIDGDFDGYIFYGFYFDSAAGKMYAYAGVKDTGKELAAPPAAPDKWFSYMPAFGVGYKTLDVTGGGKALFFDGFDAEGKTSGGLKCGIEGDKMTLKDKDDKQVMSGVLSSDDEFGKTAPLAEYPDDLNKFIKINGYGDFEDKVLRGKGNVFFEYRGVNCSHCEHLREVIMPEMIVGKTEKDVRFYQGSSEIYRDWVSYWDLRVNEDDYVPSVDGDGSVYHYPVCVFFVDGVAKALISGIQVNGKDISDEEVAEKILAVIDEYAQ